MSTPYFTQHKTIELQRLKFGLIIRLPVEFEQERIDDIISYHVSGYVYSQDAGRKETFKYPADWWEAFKERWFSEWLLKRYPVKYIHKEFIVKATYPDLNVQSHDPILRLIRNEWNEKQIKKWRKYHLTHHDDEIEKSEGV